MKKTTTFGLIAILTAIIFTACDTSYFDDGIDGLATPNLTIKAPVGEITYTLSELFEKLGSDQFENTDTKELSFSYTKSFSGDNDGAFDATIASESVGPKTITTPITATQFISIGGSPFTIPNGSALISDIEINDAPVQKKLTISQELTTAVFNGGRLIIDFNSSFDSEIELTLKIPSLKKKSDATPFTETFILPTENGENYIDLNLYNADFTHNGTAYNTEVNNFVIELDALFKFRENDVLKDSDKIIYSVQLDQVTTEVIFGDFKNESFSLAQPSISLDFFESFGESDIDFKNASMSISATNDYGFPIGVDLSGIQGTTGSTSVDLVYDGDNGQPNLLIIDPVVNYGDSKKTTNRVLNNTNSNIGELLNAKPTQIDLLVSGAVNPLGTNQNFYATSNEGLDVDLTIAFDKVEFIMDAIEFNVGEDIDPLKKLLIKATTINSIPLSGNMKIHFVNDTDGILFTKNIDVFKAAPIDNLGNSTGATTSNPTDLELDTDEITELKKATHLRVEITLDTTGADSVQLNGQDEIKLILSADIDIDGESFL